MECRHCGSTNIELSKLIGLSNDGTKAQYHYWVKCLDCKRRYATARTKEVFEMLKNETWRYSDRYKASPLFNLKQQNMTYSEKLKDPRWQKVRLRILDRDNFTCKACGDKDSTLHVHHLTYEKDREPWDYPDTNFITMCWECHQYETDNRYDQEKAFLKNLKQTGFLCDDIRILEKFLIKMILSGEFKRMRDFRRFMQDITEVLTPKVMASLRKKADKKRPKDL